MERPQTTGSDDRYAIVKIISLEDSSSYTMVRIIKDRKPTPYSKWIENNCRSVGVSRIDSNILYLVNI